MSGPEVLDRFERVAQSRPCPVCAKPDWCLHDPKNGDAICRRVESDRYWGDAGWFHPGEHRESSRRNDPAWHPRTAPARPVKSRSKDKRTPDFERLVRESTATISQACYRDDLAEQLGVSTGALGRLKCGWGGKSWLIPERDATGRIIGVTTRYTDGRKKMVSGSKRGLTYADGWETFSGPVFLVEGASDTAALMTLGLSVIGRPSNTGGCQLLGELLKNISSERQIIVVAERDLKDNGRWPGKTGAISTAQQLAKILGRPVSWGFPPGEAKDSRAWLNADGYGPRSELRQRWLDGLQIEQTFEPPSIERFAPDVRPVVSIEGYRGQMVSTRLATIGQPGVWIDAGETGVGKSTADGVVLEHLNCEGRLPKTLLVYPIHANGQEVLDDLIERGLDAAKFPKRVSTATEATNDDHGQPVEPNCWNPAADTIEKFGLSAPATVCLTCHFKDRCQREGYLGEVKAASAATIAVATHARAAAQSLDALAEGRSLVSIHEDCRAVLRPELSCTRRDMQASRELCSDLLENPRWRDWFAGNPDNAAEIGRRESLDEAVQFIAVVVDELVSILMERAPGLVTYTPPSPPQTGVNIQFQLARWLTSESQRTETPNYDRPWPLLLAILSGSRIQSVAVDGVHSTVTAFLRNDPPETATTWLCDATAKPEDISLLIGKPVERMTPEGRIENMHSMTQIPADITRSKALPRVADLVRAVMAEHPQKHRVGIICHRTHATGLVNALGEPFASKVAKVTYFASGKDRSCNSWVRDCDFLIVVGTPRQAPHTIEKELIRRGHIDAVGNQPTWGESIWEGITPHGITLQITGLGYIAGKYLAEWREVNQSLTRSALRQAIGRARTNNVHGIPVVVLSNECLGLNVKGDPFYPLSTEEVRILTFLSDLSPLRSNTNLLERSGDNAQSTADMSKRAKLSMSQTRDYLVSLERRGLVTRHGERGGWSLSSVAADLFSPGEVNLPLATEHDL